MKAAEWIKGKMGLGKSTPSNARSSLTIADLVVYSAHNLNTYDQSEQAQTLPRDISPVGLAAQTPSIAPSRRQAPPVPVQQEENRKKTVSWHQSSEELAAQASSNLPPRRKAPPVPVQQEENHAKTLTQHQSTVGLTAQAPSMVPARRKAPPIPIQQKEPGVTTQTQYQNTDELTRKAPSLLRPRSEPPPIPVQQAEIHKNSQTKYQNSEEHTSETPPPCPPRIKVPPVNTLEAENHRKSLFRDENPEDITDDTSSCQPHRIKSLPGNAQKAENRRKDAREDDDGYLKENTPLESRKSESNNVYETPQSSSRPKMTADKNYEANHESDISFRKGNVLQLIRDGEVDGWCFVRNLTTGKEGYVPANWVPVITSSDVESQKCFFKKMDRQEAEEKLLEKGIKTGTYLLRPSGGAYALSLRFENELYELEIKHYRIRVIDNGMCYIEADSNSKPFCNIVELINYYTEEPGLRCKLETPLPRGILLNDLAVEFSEVKLGEKLGNGNFASVYAGTLRNNRQVAVKSLKAKGLMTVEEFMQEAETMHKLRHPNLVSLLAICEGNDKIYIITERMSKGALINLLRGDTKHTIKFMDLLDMAIQVAEGMCYLEKKLFVHRDLRAANVLVGDGNITKIADFGLARLLDSYYEHEEFYQVQKGTAFPVKWTAPEAAKQKKFNVKSDVWSFGILLYEMVTYGDEPYAGMDNHEAIRWLGRGNRLERPTKHKCPLMVYTIMRQCWLENSNERPNFAYIKEMLIEIKVT